MSQLLENLFLGSYIDAKDKKFLSFNGITHIVTVGIELQTFYPKLYKYLYIPAKDTIKYKLSVYFDQIADFIHNAIDNEKGKVFVHCREGISRSTTSVIAYLIKYCSMSLVEARSFVKSKRSSIFPNPGFMQQLNTYSHGFESKKIEDKEEPNKRNKEIRLRSKGDSKSLERKLNVVSKKVRLSNSMNRIKKNNAKDENEIESIYTYCCKNCGFKVFTSSDIVHNTGRDFSPYCDVIYLDKQFWKEKHKECSKILCPNTKCDLMIGFMGRIGGKCGCNKTVDNLCGFYPLKFTCQKLEQ